MNKIILMTLLLSINLQAVTVENRTNQIIEIDSVSYSDMKNSKFWDYEFELEPGQTWELNNINGLTIAWKVVRQAKPGCSYVDAKAFKNLTDSTIIIFNCDKTEVKN